MAVKQIDTAWVSAMRRRVSGSSSWHNSKDTIVFPQHYAKILIIVLQQTPHPMPAPSSYHSETYKGLFRPTHVADPGTFRSER